MADSSNPQGIDNDPQEIRDVWDGSLPADAPAGYPNVQTNTAPAQSQAQQSGISQEGLIKARATLEANMKAGQIDEAEYQRLGTLLDAAQMQYEAQQAAEQAAATPQPEMQPEPIQPQYPEATLDVRAQLEEAKNMSMGANDADITQRLDRLAAQTDSSMAAPNQDGTPAPLMTDMQVQTQPSVNPDIAAQEKELVEQTRDLYKQREAALQRYESIEGHQGNKAAAFGAAGAAATAWALNKMGNSRDRIGGFVKELQTNVLDSATGEISPTKMDEAVKRLIGNKKGEIPPKLFESVNESWELGVDAFKSNDDLISAITNESSNFLRKTFRISEAGINNKATTWLQENIEGLEGTQLEKLADSLTKKAQELGGAKKDDAIAKILSEFPDDLQGLIADKADDVSTFIQRESRNISHYAAGAKRFANGHSDAADALQEKINNGNVITGTIGKISDKFNQIGDTGFSKGSEGTKKLFDKNWLPTEGHIKQGAVVAAVIGAGVAVAWGADKVLKANNEKERNTEMDTVDTLNVRIQENQGRLESLSKEAALG